MAYINNYLASGKEKLQGYEKVNYNCDITAEKRLHQDISVIMLYPSASAYFRSFVSKIISTF